MLPQWDQLISQLFPPILLCGTHGPPPMAMLYISSTFAGINTPGLMSGGPVYLGAQVWIVLPGPSNYLRGSLHRLTTSFNVLSY